eukprot:7376122-Prymnesium_polylepis.1
MFDSLDLRDIRSDRTDGASTAERRASMCIAQPPSPPTKLESASAARSVTCGESEPVAVPGAPAPTAELRFDTVGSGVTRERTPRRGNETIGQGGGVGAALSRFLPSAGGTALKLVGCAISRIVSCRQRNEMIFCNRRCDAHVTVCPQSGDLMSVLTPETPRPRIYTHTSRRLQSVVWRPGRPAAKRMAEHCSILKTAAAPRADC